MTRGTILLLGGINDIWLVARSWRWSLTRSGLPHDVEVFRWQQGFVAVLTFADLWRTSHHLTEATRLAERIREIRSERPGEPVHVIAHSAGTLIAAKALEALSPDEAVASAVFVGSALSPGYDLSEALRRTQVGLLSVESHLDIFFLGIGTMTLGTADRHWGPAAGMVGFREPGDPAQAKKLVRTVWTPRLFGQGWVGGHSSVASPRFVWRTLVPWIVQAESEEATSDGQRATSNGS